MFIQIPVGKAEDLSNQVFGKLTVLYRIKAEIKQAVWACQCECGKIVAVRAQHLKNGHTQSCGCYKKICSMQDITGQKFGKLTVLKYSHTQGKGHSYWECLCDCGTIKTIRKDGLINGSVLSCGCHHKARVSQCCTRDLTGEKFGKLTALERAGSNKHHVALWLCQCECGNTKIISSQALLKGESQSCGCIKSRGEEKISSLLRAHLLNFEREVSFDTCCLPSGNKAKFDFLVNNQYLIEFDGIQHYHSGTGWRTEEKVKLTQESDLIKNNWCQENNIPLIRIPYTHLKELNIQDLCLETSKFVINKKE